MSFGRTEKRTNLFPGEEDNGNAADNDSGDFLGCHFFFEEDGAEEECTEETHLGNGVDDGGIAAGIHACHEKDDACNEESGDDADGDFRLVRPGDMMFAYSGIQDATDNPEDGVDAGDGIDIRSMRETDFVGEAHAGAEQTGDDGQNETDTRLREVVRGTLARHKGDDGGKCADDADDEFPAGWFI